MDIDKLINEITCIVMDKIQNECCSKPKLFILAEDRGYGFENILKDVASIEYYSDTACVDSYDMILSPSICPSGLANIAQGTFNGKLQKLYLEAILKGKTLLQLKEGIEYHKYKDTIPPSLLSLYQEYENALKDFGVKFVSISELPQTVRRLLKSFDVNGTYDLTHDADKLPHAAKNTARQLVTEKYVTELYDNGIRELCLGKGDIITPLAVDFIRTNNMVIKRA